MGYHGEFGFNIVIPAKHVEEAEQVLYKQLGLLDGQVETPKEGGFCDVFNEHWGDTWSDEPYAEERKPSPLHALADGQFRGEITIFGHTTKKWRDWEQPLVEALAPYVEAGGTISVKGEDWECASIWAFDGKTVVVDEYTPTSTKELEELRAKAERLKEAEAMLGELRYAFSRDPSKEERKVIKNIENFLSCKARPALEQLAECAE